jgi:hypothetical protein
MKAYASSNFIYKIEWLLVIIPLAAGYSPARWKNFRDIMILRKGFTHLGGLWAVVLFLVDCNFAIKHVGQRMMQ